MPAKPAYPKKLFYKIQEVANIVGVEPYVLRYWETKFPMLSPEKDGNDQRRYRQKDIEVLLQIRYLLHDEKYTIAGAVEKMRDEKGGKKSRPGPEAVSPAAAAIEESVPDLFDEPSSSDPAASAFDEGQNGMSADQLERLRRLKDELGLMRRELENWRDELAE